jgi:NitT/TauT family transport system substrate-binding protein
MEGNSFSLFDLIGYCVKGADLVVVSKTDSSFGIDGIVAKKGIKNIRDLKGKRVGIAQHTYAEYLLDVVLEHNRLAPEDVVKVEVVVEEASKLLLQGKVDAVVSWEPYLTQAVNKAGGRMLFDTSEIPGLNYGIDVFHRSFIEERPGDVQAYLNVWHKTTRFIKEYPEEAFTIIAEIYDTSPEEVRAIAQIDRISDLHYNMTSFSYAAGLASFHGSSRKMNNFIIRKGITKQRVDTTRIIDTRFVRALK